MKTLAEARKEFRDTIKGEGGKCPCCRRWGKINGYQITSTQARGLIWMYKNFRKNAWIDLGKAPKWILRSKSMATLHHWDLVQAKAKTEDEDKRGSGLWKLTDWGRQFVRKEVTVPKHAFVFNKTLIKHSKDRVNIVTALGKKFSYDELMHTTYRNTK